MTDKEKLKFIRQTKYFFVDKEGCLYHNQRGETDKPQLVVERDKRMRMLNNAHDSLGHKGVYATQHLLEKRFWWPELYKDVEWYVASCIPCQH